MSERHSLEVRSIISTEEFRYGLGEELVFSGPTILS